MLSCKSKKTDYSAVKSEILKSFAQDDIKKSDSLLSELNSEAFESDLDYYYLYTMTSLSLGNLKRADSLISLWKNKYNEDGRLYHCISIYYHENGDYEKALLFINKSLKIESNNHLGLNRKAQILSKFENNDSVFKEAKLSLDRAYFLYPNPTYKHNLGYLYFQYGLFDSSIFVFTKLIEKDGGNSEFFIARGSSYYYQNNIKLAENDFVKADSLSPNSPSSKYHLGLIQIVNEDFETGCLNMLKCDSLGGYKDHKILLKQCQDYGWYD